MALNLEMALGVVSGDGEAALHRVGVVYGTTATANVCDPLHPLPWSLANLVHSIDAEGESRGYTGEF